MTKIKGTQILEQTTDFSIFVVDENGNIQLPENIKFNEAKILTEYDINKLIVRKKVEKLSNLNVFLGLPTCLNISIDFPYPTIETFGKYELITEITFFGFSSVLRIT